MPDQTLVTNFPRDQQACPVYITLGNLASGRHNSPTSMAVLLLALLLISPKLSKSSKADQHQRQINTDTLRDVFKLIFAPQQDPPHDGVPMDCADGKVRSCFTILATWIADHMQNVALYGIKSNVCPRGKVPAVKLSTKMKVSPVRDYAIYHHYNYENWIAETDITDIMPESLGIRSGQNVFTGSTWFRRQIYTNQTCFLQFILGCSST